MWLPLLMELYFLVGYRVANSDIMPEWKPGTEFKAETRRDAAIGPNGQLTPQRLRLANSSGRNFSATRRCSLRSFRFVYHTHAAATGLSTMR
jgi:hypothetical protein